MCCREESAGGQYSCAEPCQDLSGSRGGRASWGLPMPSVPFPILTASLGPQPPPRSPAAGTPLSSLACQTYPHETCLQRAPQSHSRLHPATCPCLPRSACSLPVLPVPPGPPPRPAPLHLHTPLCAGIFTHHLPTKQLADCPVMAVSPGPSQSLSVSHSSPRQ